jgi:hypothetical protein
VRKQSTVRLTQCQGVETKCAAKGERTLICIVVFVVDARHALNLPGFLALVDSLPVARRAGTALVRYRANWITIRSRLC